MRLSRRAFSSLNGSVNSALNGSRRSSISIVPAELNSNPRPRFPPETSDIYRFRPVASPIRWLDSVLKSEFFFPCNYHQGSPQPFEGWCGINGSAACQVVNLGLNDDKSSCQCMAVQPDIMRTLRWPSEGPHHRWASRANIGQDWAPRPVACMYLAGCRVSASCDNVFLPKLAS